MVMLYGDHRTFDNITVSEKKLYLKIFDTY